MVKPIASYIVRPVEESYVDANQRRITTLGDMIGIVRGFATSHFGRSPYLVAPLRVQTSEVAEQ